MKRYDSYKDSGVKWLGEIPSHWEMLALKHILKHKKEVVGKHSSQYDLLSLTLKGVIIRDMDNPEGKFPASFDTYQIVEPNDFIFCNFDNEETPRAVGLSQYKGMITGAYDVLYRNNPLLSDKYLIYYFLYIDDSKRFKPLYKGLRKTVPFDSFMSYKIPVPSRGEQDAVVEYLDAATSKIDEAIAQQQKMIDLLNERKQIIINNAVTKGLDPNVKMKPSGIDWIGDIPEHWEIVPIKRFIDVRDGTHDTPYYVEKTDNTYPLITSKDFIDGHICYDDVKWITYSDFLEIDKRSHVNKYDVLTSMIGGNIGKTVIVKNNYPIAIKNVALLRTNGNYNLAKYIYYYMIGGLISIQVDINSRGGAQSFLGLNDMRNLVYFDLPNQERIKIVDYLDFKVRRIDGVINNCQNQISLLQERKQIIINDVVTGKVKVI